MSIHVRARRSLAAAIVPALAAAPPIAAGASPAGAEQGAPTEDRARLAKIVDRLVAQGAIGVTAEVRTRGRTHRFAAGHAQLDPKAPAREDARLRAGSVNKQLTSVLALQQVERGRWTLDTTTGDVLPRLWPGRADITLRQMLSHTSGMPDVVSALVSGAGTIEEFVRLVSTRRTDRELPPARLLPGRCQSAPRPRRDHRGHADLVLRRCSGRRTPGHDRDDRTSLCEEAGGGGPEAADALRPHRRCHRVR